MLTKKQTFITTAMTILAGVAAFGNPQSIHAEDIHHTVKQGEYLYSIAPQYGTTVDQLIEWNQLDSINLQIGDTLIVSKDDDSSEVVETPQPSEPEAPITSGSYTVKAGDSLYRIANKFGVTVDELIKANPFAKVMIHPGDTLVIPSGTTVTPPEEVEEEPSTPVEETPEAGSYTVKAGDYLYLIANKFDITVDQLKAANKMESNMIHPGDVLVIPTNTTTPPTEEPGDKPETPEQTKYTVKAGDSLYRIANKFSVTVDELIKANPFAKTMIHPGDFLVIPGEKDETPTEKPEEEVTEKQSYTVKAGDYLYLIANKYGITVDALKEANNMTSNMIHPGDKLTIPVGGDVTQPDEDKEEEPKETVYIVQSGDSLYRISRKYSITVDELIKANPFAKTMIHPGDKLVIPTQSKPVEDKEDTVIETEPTAIDNFLLDKKTFKNITDAVEYGRKVFDNSKYKEFYVEYLNGSYRVFWEVK